MQNDATFDKQINKIVEIGKQLSGWILEYLEMDHQI